jgi:hypothetical protein
MKYPKAILHIVCRKASIMSIFFRYLDGFEGVQSLIWKSGSETLPAQSHKHSVSANIRKPVLGIRTFLGLLDPDPLDRGGVRIRLQIFPFSNKGV